MSRLLIVNPFASGVDEHTLAAVRAALPKDTETRLTTAAGEATEIARGADDVEAIYVLGGDGTYNEVLNGVERRRTARVPSRRRDERSPSGARAPDGIPVKAAQARRRGANAARSGSGASTDAGSGSTQASASTRSSSGASTNSDAVPTGGVPATSPSCGSLPRCSGSGTRASTSRSRSTARGGRHSCSSRTARRTRTRARSRSTSSQAPASTKVSRTSRR